jgi:eukaryotic-like serine/threonine-protein kinase
MATQTQSFLQGELVDEKYHLRRYLGGSEHSAVFLTQHGGVHLRDAAIKLMPAPPGNAEAKLSRWRLAANLSHRHLVRILEMGRCRVGNAPMLYVVTELASENLGEIIPQRALTPEETRDMLAGLLDALVFLHSRGFVHGRVKPSNIMAVGEELKLSSDSICRLGENVENGSAPSFYDLPEGSRGGATTAGDIWSLGVTLVEVLTQEPPEWSASSRRDPTPPETMPPPFPEIVRHCLRRDPKNRWPAATILAHVPRTVAAPVRVVQPVAEPVVVERAPQASLSEKLNAMTPLLRGYAERGATAVANLAHRGRRYALPGAAAIGALALIFAGVEFVGRHKAPPATTSQTLAASQTRAQTNSESQPAIEQPARSVPAPPPVSAPERATVRPQGNERPKHVVATPERVAPPPEAVAKKIAPKAPAAAAPSSSRPSSSLPASSPSTSGENVAPSTPIAGVTPGRVLQRALPDVPRKASNTIWGTVRVGVRVSVDASGNVTGASFESAGPSRYFARLSLEAARKWQFAAPTRDGQAVASVWVLHFGYRRDGTNVEPSQVEP